MVREKWVNADRSIIATLLRKRSRKTGNGTFKKKAWISASINQRFYIGEEKLVLVFVILCVLAITTFKYSYRKCFQELSTKQYAKPYGWLCLRLIACGHVCPKLTGYFYLLFGLASTYSMICQRKLDFLNIRISFTTTVKLQQQQQLRLQDR